MLTQHTDGSIDIDFLSTFPSSQTPFSPEFLTLMALQSLSPSKKSGMANRRAKKGGEILSLDFDMFNFLLHKADYVIKDHVHVMRALRRSWHVNFVRMRAVICSHQENLMLSVLQT